MQDPAELHVEIFTFAAVAIIAVQTCDRLVIVVVAAGDPQHPVAVRYRVVGDVVAAFLAAVVVEIVAGGEIE